MSDDLIQEVQPSPAPEKPGIAVLAAKMAQVMGKLTRIKKDGLNAEQKWRYASIDAITDAIREAMSEAGLALFATMIESSVEPAQSIYGKSLFRAKVLVEFEIVCTDTGTSKTMRWNGTADDYGDKALNKAGTYAEKFWLLRTFLVSTGDDDPDSESPGHEEEEKRPKNQQRNRENSPRQQSAPPRQTQSTPNQAQSPGWLTDENKSKLLVKARKDNRLPETAAWADFLRVAGLKDDAACARFASGADLYLHFDKKAQETASPDEKIVVVRRARHGKNIIFPEAEVTWFKGRKEFAKLVGAEFAAVMDVNNWNGTEKTPMPYEFPALTLHLVKAPGKQFYEIVKAEPAVKPGTSPLAQPDSPAGENPIDPNDIDAFLGDVDPDYEALEREAPAMPE